ncbi:MAG: hypothetical protein H0V53_05145 [Rubrobacter sp.]|nr:hypothetical protein [Rubrobacter sp.]
MWRTRAGRSEADSGWELCLVKNVSDHRAVESDDVTRVWFVVERAVNEEVSRRYMG